MEFLNMTSIKSLASTSSLPSLDIMDVSADAILWIGSIRADLKRANMQDGHEVFGMLNALQQRFINITSADGHTTYVDPRTLNDDVVPAGFGDDAEQPIIAPTIENKDPAPVLVNDITARRNQFCTELASRKRMTRKEALAFIGHGAADILIGLVEDGTILHTARGRSAGYRLPEVKVTPITPTLTDAEMSVVCAAVVASYGADQTTVESIDKQSGEGLAQAYNVPQKRKAGRPRKTPKVVVPPTPAPVEIIASGATDIPEGFGDTVEPINPPAIVHDAKAEARLRQLESETRQIADATTAELLAELTRRIATAVPAQNKGRANSAIKELSRVFNLS